MFVGALSLFDDYYSHKVQDQTRSNLKRFLNKYYYIQYIIVLYTYQMLFSPEDSYDTSSVE